MAKTRVIIEISGGIVQSVYTPKDGVDVEVEIFDLDVSAFATEEEEKAAEQMAAAIDKLESDKNWIRLG